MPDDELPMPFAGLSKLAILLYLVITVLVDVINFSNFSYELDFVGEDR